MFVFRNNTIERFFPSDYSFSGYDDVSFVPNDADGYVWFYQAPIGFDYALLASEMDSYLQKFDLVCGQISANKTIIAFTIDELFDVRLLNSDFRVTDAIARYNKGLEEAAVLHPNVKIIDIKEPERLMASVTSNLVISSNSHLLSLETLTSLPSK